MRQTEREMKLTRFCSHTELRNLLREGVITNDTDHYRGGKGGSTSQGFCLATDPPEVAWKYLKGIVTPGVCLVYEIPKEKLTSTVGKYKGEVKHLPDGREIITPKYLNEYCTPVLHKEWIEKIIPLETIIPADELEVARYCYLHKEELMKYYETQS